MVIETPSTRLKVFISYSRKDLAFAEELASGLEVCGFDAYLDKEDIAPGEPWEARIAGLIRSADTVVFIISPDAVKSERCSWEVTQAHGESKRLLPVVLRPVPDSSVPNELGRLNYVFFDAGRSFAKSLGELAQALRLDLRWIREHTRLAELAARWEERDKPKGLLLRPEEIGDAKGWLASRPRDAPEVTQKQEALIEESIRATAEEEQRRGRLRWRAKAATLAALVVTAIGATTSTLGWRQAAASREELKARVNELRAANLRLSRRIALRVAPTGARFYAVGPNWYQIATDYAGAIAVITTKDGSRNMGTGFMVRGSELHASWAGAVVFVTGSFVLGRDGLDPGQAKVWFPGLEVGHEGVRLGEVLWEQTIQDDGLGVSITRVKGPLPAAAKAIDRVRHAEVEGLEEAFSRGTSRAEPPRAVATVAWGARVGYSLFLHELIGASGRDSAGRATRLVYSHATEEGAGGAPVFDVETGELVAVHQSRLPHPAGQGASIVAVLAAIDADLERSR